MKKEHVFVDTGLLRDHVSKLQQQKKLACILHENVVAMKKLSEDSDVNQFNSILRELDDMIEYYERMARVLAHIEDEAHITSHRIGRIIEESTERTRHIISENLML